MTEPTPKPTDALDLLKKLAGGVDPEKCSPFQAMAREWALEAIAAWEKERAEVGGAFIELMRQDKAIRAALERIEGEMLDAAERVEYGQKELNRAICRWADALRAAREGGK